MADEVDRLEVVVEAQASKANKQLDTLVTKLDKVANSLSRVNSSGLTGLANGVSKLSTAMQSMNNVKSTDFTRLAKNIEKLNSLDTTNLYRTASALNTISSAYTRLGNSASSVGTIRNTTIPTVSTGTPTTNTNSTTSTNQNANSIRNLSNQSRTATTSLRSLASRLSYYTRVSDSASNSSKSFAYYLGKLYANYYL